MQTLCHTNLTHNFHSRAIGRGMLAIIAAASLTLPGVSAWAADSIVGKWVGTLQQQPAATSSSYQGEFTLSSPTSGTSRYSSLSCGGTLSGGETGGVYRFRESITFGGATATSGGCIDGNIEMVVSGDTATLNWSGSWKGQSIVVSGTLHRVDNLTTSWSAGRWVRGDSVANVAGGCFTTWACHPASQIMRSKESEILSTESKRTRGACQVTDNPEECGRCLSNEPEASCRYCVQSVGCSNPNLGFRTREAMGCCPAK
jgi:hypothetical protein